MQTKQQLWVERLSLTGRMLGSVEVILPGREEKEKLPRKREEPEQYAVLLTCEVVLMRGVVLLQRVGPATMIAGGRASFCRQGNGRLDSIDPDGEGDPMVLSNLDWIEREKPWTYPKGEVAQRDRAPR